MFLCIWFSNGLIVKALMLPNCCWVKMRGKKYSERSVGQPPQGGGMVVDGFGGSDTLLVKKTIEGERWKEMNGSNENVRDIFVILRVNYKELTLVPKLKGPTILSLLLRNWWEKRDEHTQTQACIDTQREREREREREEIGEIPP